MMRVVVAGLCVAGLLVAGLAAPAAAQTMGPPPPAPPNIRVGANAIAGTVAPTWLEKLAPSVHYATAAPILALAPPGGVGSSVWHAARASDAQGVELPNDNAIVWADTIPNGLTQSPSNPWSIWARYTESDLTSSFTVAVATTAGSTAAQVAAGTPVVVGMPVYGSNVPAGEIVAAFDGVSGITLSKPATGGSAFDTFGTTGYHIGEENSTYSLWAYVPTDPFGFNPQGATRNLRLDCGKGPAGTSYQAMGVPQKCGAALEIVDNGAKYGKGIMIGANTLDTSEFGLGQAFVMAPMQALVWYAANHTPGWSIYQDAMTGAAGAQYQLHLGNGFAQIGATLLAPQFVSTAGTPASATAACTQGTMQVGSNGNLYVCTATNTWKTIVPGAFQ